MEHTSKNTMNDMILANNAKQANKDPPGMTGKRSRSDAGLDDPESGEPTKRKKKQPGLYSAYLQGKD